MTPRVMFLGDAHANIGFMRSAIDACPKVEANLIVQVGDFGIWDHVPGGAAYLNNTNAALEAADLILVFVDGNHENFDSLYEYPMGDDGFRRVRDRIWHAPRGHTWAWEGVRFGAMGGAHSIDALAQYGGIWEPWSNRQPGEGWWPQETITDEDVASALEIASNPKLVAADGSVVDVLVSHDAPYSVDIPGIGGYPMGNENRRRLEQVTRAWKPHLQVCGHYHRRHTGVVDHGDTQTRVEILAHDKSERGGNYLLLDLDPFRLVMPA